MELAIERNQLKFVKYLIQNVQFPNYELEQTLTHAVKIAIKEKDDDTFFEMIKLLLESTHVTNSAIYFSIQSSKVKLLKLLCPLNANPSFDLANYASQCGCLESLKYLLSIMSNPSDHMKSECLKIAILNGHLHLVKWFLEGKKAILPIPYLRKIACEAGKLDVLKYLIEGFEDFTIKEFYELIVVSSSRYLETLKYLVEEVSKFMNLTVVDLNKAVSYWGKSALWNATDRGLYLSVQYLLDNGANICGKSNNNSLIIACKNNCLNIVKLFLQSNNNGLDVNRSDDHGKSPLFIASQKGFIEIVKLLIQRKDIKLDKRNEKSQTPLHIACNSGSLEIVKLLVENAADLEQCDGKGNTPLMIACRWKPAIVEYLISKGANINAINKDKKNPLMISTLTKNLKAMSLLSKINAIS